MKSWDAIIIGGGVIGMSLALSLRKEDLRVLVVERGEPGREASWAAAGMLVGSGLEMPPALHGLAAESARIYPGFVHELEDESGLKIDFRDRGTIVLSHNREFPPQAESLSDERLRELEPDLAAKQNGYQAAYVSERSVDPRSLMAALIKAARHRGIDVSSGSEAQAVLTRSGRITGVQSDKTAYSAAIVINCAGAWAGRLGPQQFPVRPAKGQMLAVVGGASIQHVVRGEDVYLVPRSDGRMVIGSTLEDAGFDKRVDIATIQRLFQLAVAIVPKLAQSKKHEDWAGLRPGTPDELPILGQTSTGGYFIASGHYRDGILLAPITAKVMTEQILKKPPSFNLESFSPARFPAATHHGDTEPRKKAI
jgi:glycine oxidase